MNALHVLGFSDGTSNEGSLDSGLFAEKWHSHSMIPQPKVDYYHSAGLGQELQH